MNSDNCNTCIWKKGNSCTQPCTGTIIKEKDQEIASLKKMSIEGQIETVNALEQVIQMREKEIAELKARLLNKDDDWIAAIQEVIDVNGEWVHSDELQTLKEQEPTYHASARQRIKESKETDSLKRRE
jgi:N-acetyl-beta-hexosaminidase